MKKIVIALGILAGISLNTWAANNTSEVSYFQTNDGWDKGKVESFINKAANVGLMEVQAGQLALQNAKNQQVRDYAQMLVQDHTASNQKLKAATVNFPTEIPTTLDNDYQNKIDKLRGSTSNFDKDFIDAMVKDHADAISDFEKARDNVNDPAIKNWIENALVMLRKHQDQAKLIKDQL